MLDKKSIICSLTLPYISYGNIKLHMKLYQISKVLSNC